MKVSSTTRRALLKSLTFMSAIVMMPKLVLAAWPKKAFEDDSVEAAITELYGTASEPSDQVTLKAPDIAENGAVVPISVTTDLPNVESISIYVEQNPNPLAATFELSKSSLADVSTRIKMGTTSNVIAAVKSGDKVYTVSREVKVTIGGCGG